MNGMVYPFRPVNSLFPLLFKLKNTSLLHDILWFSSTFELVQDGLTAEISGQGCAWLCSAHLTH